MTKNAEPSRLGEIVALSRHVGEPERDLVILAEGNTSLRTSPRHMLVKASGNNMAKAGTADFVEVDLPRFWELIDSESEGDAAVDALFRDSITWGTGRPSVESLLHAVCLRHDAIDAVVHTHPIVVNTLLCSDKAESLTGGALFPDQIVVLGRHALLVPYVDPGLPLARHVDRALTDYVERHGERPRVIYLQNHGVFALGSSPEDALAITAMVVKCARILVGAHSVGVPTYLSEDHGRRIDTRPDEILRRQMLEPRNVVAPR